LALTVIGAASEWTGPDAKKKSRRRKTLREHKAELRQGGG